MREKPYREYLTVRGLVKHEKRIGSRWRCVDKRWQIKKALRLRRQTRMTHNFSFSTLTSSSDQIASCPYPHRLATDTWSVPIPFLNLYYHNNNDESIVDSFQFTSSSKGFRFYRTVLSNRLSYTFLNDCKPIYEMVKIYWAFFL